MQIMFGILYVLAGVLLAIPYCFLAGWSADSFLTVAFVAPAFLYVWFMMAAFAGIIEPGHKWWVHFNWRAALGKSDRQMLSRCLLSFWMWTLYSFLPVIFHWGAVFLERIGFKTVSTLINTHRYLSPLYVFVSTLILFVLIEVGTSAWETAKKTWTRIVHW